MPKKRSSPSEDSKDSEPKQPKQKKAKVSLETDPQLSTDYDKINELLNKKKTWREIANYFQNHNADSIKKRYQLARRVLMETITPEDDTKLAAFLDKYEKEKFAVAGKELGKSARAVAKRAKDLKLLQKSGK